MHIRYWYSLLGVDLWPHNILDISGISKHLMKDSIIHSCMCFTLYVYAGTALTF